MREALLVADIQRSSTGDGPGLRTTVFFKGCPLACAWCHNPECISFSPEPMFYPEKCIGCGKCADGCYAGARVTCGKPMTPEEILAEILPDRVYYGSDGGVTFSGGEPLAQAEGLRECIRLCRENGISCAVETSLFLYDESIFRSLALVMADLKVWDDKLHRELTGVGNEIIKENFRKLDKLGVPILARTPVIPEIDQGIPEIAAFLKELPSVCGYELLPYHPLGVSKAKALGKEQRRFSIPSESFMEDKKQYAFIR